jgi:hypothetical protein
MHLVTIFKSHRSRLLMLAAAVIYLLSQSIDLQHTHDGDLNLHADCQICMKLGSQNDVAVAASALPQVEAADNEFRTTLPDLTVASIKGHNSRAPPHSV